MFSFGFFVMNTAGECITSFLVVKFKSIIIFFFFYTISLIASAAIVILYVISLFFAICSIFTPSKMISVFNSSTSYLFLFFYYFIHLHIHTRWSLLRVEWQQLPSNFQHLSQYPHCSMDCFNSFFHFQFLPNLDSNVFFICHIFLSS